MDVTTKYYTKGTIYNQTTPDFVEDFFVIGGGNIYYDIAAAPGGVEYDLSDTEYYDLTHLQLPDMDPLPLNFKSGGNLTAELSTVFDVLGYLDATFDPGTVFAIDIDGAVDHMSGVTIPGGDELSWTEFWNGLAEQSSNDPGDPLDFHVAAPGFSSDTLTLAEQYSTKKGAGDDAAFAAYLQQLFGDIESAYKEQLTVTYGNGRLTAEELSHDGAGFGLITATTAPTVMSGTPTPPPSSTNGETWIDVGGFWHSVQVLDPDTDLDDLLEYDGSGAATATLFTGDLGFIKPGQLQEIQQAADLAELKSMLGFDEMSASAIEKAMPTNLALIWDALAYYPVSPETPGYSPIPFKVSGSAKDYFAEVGSESFFGDVSDLSGLRFNGDFTLEIALTELPSMMGMSNVLDLTGNHGHTGVVKIRDALPDVREPIGQTAMAESPTLEVRVSADITVQMDSSLAGALDLNVVTVGTGGDDTINGGSSYDNIEALGGDDTIDGGEGDDFLDGGSGADTFAFTDGDGHDIIEKFVSDEDLLSITIDGVTKTYSPEDGNITLAAWKDATVEVGTNDHDVITVETVEGRTLITYGATLGNTIDLGIPEVAPNVRIAETGERWGDYIVYGVYATSDLTALETMNATLAWWDQDYSLVPGSVAEGVRSDGMTSENIFSDYGSFSISSFTGRSLSNDDYNTFDGISFGFNAQASDVPAITDIAAGELLVEFMLERDGTAPSKVDTITLTDLEINGGYSSNNPFYFDFDTDTFNIDLATHSSLDARAPNGKIFISDGSVVDGLALTPKAVQTEDEWGDNIVEYDINLRVSRPILELETVKMPHEATSGHGYLLEVSGQIDTDTFIEQISGDLPAGLAATFYEVDERLLAASDVSPAEGVVADGIVTWAEALAGGAVTEITPSSSEPDAQGFYAWGSTDAQDTTVIIELDTSSLGVFEAYTATEGTFSIGSFLGMSYEEDDGSSFAIEYLSSSGVIEGVTWTASSGNSSIRETEKLISTDWISLSDDVHTTTDDFVISDGYEAVILGDKFYENPIGFKPSVTAEDARLVLDMVAAVSPDYTNTQYISADFDQSGSVDVVDAEQILKYSARMVTEDVSTDETPVIEFISRPEWFYIDDIEGTKYQSVRDDVKFDEMLDLFVGRTENIDATAVLTGDVSAEFVNVPDGLNPIYLNNYMVTVHDIM